MDINFLEDEIKKAEQHIADLQREIVATSGAIKAFQFVIENLKKEGAGE